MTTSCRREAVIYYGAVVDPTAPRVRLRSRPCASRSRTVPGVMSTIRRTVHLIAQSDDATVDDRELAVGRIQDRSEHSVERHGKFLRSPRRRLRWPVALGCWRAGAMIGGAAGLGAAGTGWRAGATAADDADCVTIGGLAAAGGGVATGGRSGCGWRGDWRLRPATGGVATGDDAVAPGARHCGSRGRRRRRRGAHGGRRDAGGLAAAGGGVATGGFDPAAGGVATGGVPVAPTAAELRRRGRRAAAGAHGGRRDRRRPRDYRRRCRGRDGLAGASAGVATGGAGRWVAGWAH